MPKGIFAALAGALIVAVFAVGCGGDSSDTARGDAASLTKAEFIKQGDAICEKADKRVEAEYGAYFKQHNIPKNKKPTKAQQEETVATIALPSIAAQAEELGDLGGPDGDAKASALLRELERALKKAEADPSTVLSGSSPFVKATVLASEYGFTVCGQ